MTKNRSHFVCQQCGRTSPQALGRCPQCGAWGSMVEEIQTVNASPARGGVPTSTSKPKRLDEIEGDAEARIGLDMREFSRVLGGGLVPGSVTLMAGDPGIGKSTLLLQAALELSTKQRVFYVSGEESERQVKMRARRLSTGFPQAGEKTNPNLSLVTETNLETILEHVRQIKPDILVIDSIQTVYLSELESSAGSVTQVRECASRLRELAKSNGLTVFIIGHVTKEGNIAGPRVLEHIVDTVLYLEGDRYQAFRLLRAVKNRFGPTSEVGVFEMQEDGLAEVENPSEAFLAERMVNAPGSAIAVTMEGTRPLLVEVQGLTSHTNFGNPRRTPNGVDLNRLLLITAVLSRHIGSHLAEQDVFVNVVGGLKINEPAADLAIAAAIYSSLRDVPIRADLVLIGETGLSGEIRWSSQMEARLNEAARLGFHRAIIPHRIQKKNPLSAGLEVIEARSLREALSLALIDPAVKNPEEKI